MPKHSHLCVKLIESTLCQLTIMICQRLFVQHAQTFSHLCAKMIESTLYQTPKPPPPHNHHHHHHHHHFHQPSPFYPEKNCACIIVAIYQECVSYMTAYVYKDKIIIPPTYGALMLHIFDVIKRFSEYYMSLFLSSSSSQYIRKFIE